jgi:hypothetical protein
MRRFRSLRTAALTAAAALAALAALPAAARAARDEYEVKAAFLLNFARLVEWPRAARPSGDAPIVIALLARQEPFRSIARSLEGATVDSHRVEVRSIESGDELPGSHIVFVSRDEQRNAAAIIEAARGHAVLSVGESAGFARLGGVINFYAEGRKLRFEINPAAAERAGIKISSRLLRLARLIEGVE